MLKPTALGPYLIKRHLLSFRAWLHLLITTPKALPTAYSTAWLENETTNPICTREAGAESAGSRSEACQGRAAPVQESATLAP